MSYFTTSALSPSTIHVYTTRINKWIQLVPLQSIEYIIRFPKESLSLLIKHLTERGVKEQKTVCTPTNLHPYLTAIVAVLRYSPHIAPSIVNRTEYYDLWLKILDQNSKPMNDRRLHQLPTRKQSERGGSKLAYEDIVAMRDRPDIPLVRKLLLGMYTYIYPVRADYYATQIIREHEKPTYPNYIRMYSDHAELKLTEFKTAKVFKAIHHPSLPEPLFHLIRQSLEESPRDFLFVNSDNKPYLRNTYSKWASETLQNMFGVELNLTMIRHLFITTVSMELPASELKKIGDLMGHTLSSQRLYKWHSVESSDEDSDR